MNFFSNPLQVPRKVYAIQNSPIKWLLILWLTGCAIALIGLGDLPLRDFDEGTVAQVSLELSKSNGSDRLLPTIWNFPYLNKPPGLHSLIAIFIQLNSFINSTSTELPDEWVIRFIPSLISTLIIPLGGLIQLKLRPNDPTSSIATSGILLTLLPIARHGRLAMLDGSQLSAMALLWYLLISINHNQFDRLRLLGAGLSSSFLLLLKAPFIIPALSAAVIPIFWDKDLRHSYRRQPLIKWFLIGVIPGCSWHIWHGIKRGTNAFWLWGSDGAGRVLFQAGEGSDLGWKVPLIEILEGGWPWLLLWPFGLLLAWRERHSQWGKWALCTQSILLLAIFPLKTQLPWYSHPLWLPLALLCGPPISYLIHNKQISILKWKNSLTLIPFLWQSIGIILLTLGGFATIKQTLSLKPYCSFAFALGFGWTAGGWLLRQSKERWRSFGVISLLAGNIAALTLLMSSSFWLWELNENWPVNPVADLATQAPNSTLFIEGSHERPSLNWYARKRIRIMEDFSSPASILTREPEKIILMQKEKKCEIYTRQNNWSIVFCTNK